MKQIYSTNRKQVRVCPMACKGKKKETKKAPKKKETKRANK